VIFLGIPVTYLYNLLSGIMRALGDSKTPLIFLILSSVLNILFDLGAILILHMGVAGAAWATVIGQLVSCGLDFIFHVVCNRRDINTGLAYLRPKPRLIKGIYAIGVPAIVMQALMSVMCFGVNIIFGTVSTEAVTAYGVYYKIQQFVFFAAFGMNNAMIPIISFNYGKGDRRRIDEGIRYGMIDTLVIMGIGLLALQLFAQPLIGIFALSAETQALCLRAIRIITLGYLFVGANIAYQGIFQALGCGIRSLILSLVRLIVVALPLAWVFAETSPSIRRGR